MKITKTLRVFLILLSVMMVLPLFACGDTPEETTTKAPEETTAPKEETTTDKKVETTEPKADATTAEPEAPATTVAPEETTEAETTSAETTEATTESGSETTETGSESSETTETETTEVETTETTEATEAPECEHVEEVIPAVAPTCEEAGLTAGAKCSLCGEILEEQEPVEAVGHAWDDGKVTTEPDCNNAGVKTFTCQNDATHTKTEAVDAKGHTPVVDAAVAPTCEKTGLTEGSHCSVCSAVINAQQTVDAIGHKWDDGVVTTEPTCEGKGVKTFTCANDATHTKTEDVEALGHKWDNGVVTTEPTCEGKGVKTFTCQNDSTHTKTEDVAANGHGEGVKDVEDNCNVKCPVCQKVLAEGQHATDKIAAAWTPVVGPMDDEGKLYEVKLCGDCGQPAETREVYYQNNCDGIYVGTTLVNPNTTGNINQTQGFGGKLSDYTTYDASVIKDREGNALVITDTFQISGWFAVNGGVARYVAKISTPDNEGTWETASGGIGSTDPTATTHIGGAINSNTNFTDDGAHLNSNYQGKAKIPGLQKFGGKTVTITFAAVPANNPGSAEEPNVLVIAVIENVSIVCVHTANENEYQVDVNDPQNLVSEACSVCGTTDIKIPATVTTDGYAYAGPDYLKSSASINGSNSKGTLVTEDNGFKYMHYEITENLKGENTLVIWSKGAAQTTASKYVGILYRSPRGSSGSEIFISKDTEFDGSHHNAIGVKANGEWQYAIIDGSAKPWATEGVYTLRYDLFNGDGQTPDSYKVGEWIDLAFVAFFETSEDAWGYYDMYIDAYLGSENCAHNGASDTWRAATDKPGYIARDCAHCGDANVSLCQHADPTKLETVEGKINCNLCGSKDVELLPDLVNGNTMFTPGDLLRLPSTAIYKSVLVDENGMPYLHVTSTNLTEGMIYLNNGGNIENVNKYFAILYRTNTKPHIELFITKKGVTTSGTHTNQQQALTNDGQWRLVVWDMSNWKYYDETGFGWTRLDILNPTNYPGAEIDVAFAGFFADRASAGAYFGEYVDKYIGAENCTHILDNNWVTTGKVDERQCACLACGGTVVAACPHAMATRVYAAAENEGECKWTCGICAHEETVKVTYTSNFDSFNYGTNMGPTRDVDNVHVFDLKDKTLTSTSISFGGWVVTPMGNAKIQYRVVSVDGTAIENPTLVDCNAVGDKAADSAITKVGTARGWTDDCRIGAGIGGTIKLADYAGKTVCVEIVVTTTYGSTYVIAEANDILVPAAQ